MQIVDLAREYARRAVPYREPVPDGYWNVRVTEPRALHCSSLVTRLSLAVLGHYYQTLGDPLAEAWAGLRPHDPRALTVIDKPLAADLVFYQRTGIRRILRIVTAPSSTTWPSWTERARSSSRATCAIGWSSTLKCAPTGGGHLLRNPIGVSRFLPLRRLHLRVRARSRIAKSNFHLHSPWPVGRALTRPPPPSHAGQVSGAAARTWLPSVVWAHVASPRHRSQRRLQHAVHSNTAGSWQRSHAVVFSLLEAALTELPSLTVIVTTPTPPASGRHGGTAGARDGRPS